MGMNPQMSTPETGYGERPAEVRELHTLGAIDLPNGGQIVVSLKTINNGPSLIHVERAEKVGDGVVFRAPLGGLTFLEAMVLRHRLVAIAERRP